MEARRTPFTHLRAARAYQAERAMIDALERRDERAERMLDRILRVLGVERAPEPAEPVA